MCCGSWGHKELDTTEELNRTDLIYSYFFVSALTGTFFVVSKASCVHFSFPSA